MTLREWDQYSWQQAPHFCTGLLYLGRYGLSGTAANVLLERLEGLVAELKRAVSERTPSVAAAASHGQSRRRTRLSRACVTGLRTASDRYCEDSADSAPPPSG